MKHLTAAVAALMLGGASLASAAPSYAAPEMCQGHRATIVATEWGELITGTEGPDVISTAGYAEVGVDGKGGDDLICAPKGRRSYLYGGAGDDRLTTDGTSRLDGGDGDDVLVARGTRAGKSLTDRAFLAGGAGDDTLRGGVETIVSYVSSSGPLTIDLVAGTATDGVSTDRLVGIHRVQGSGYADTFIGTASSDHYESYPKLMESGAPMELPDLRTGAGDDTVFIRNLPQGAVGAPGRVDAGPGDDRVSVPASTVLGGAGADRISVRGFGTAAGGRGADRLYGRINVDARAAVGPLVLHGGPGADRLFVPSAFRRWSGESACPEQCASGDLFGGSGLDTLELASSREAVVDLLAGTVRHRTGSAVLHGIENVEGTRYRDSIRGDDGPNHLDGNGGDDVLVGLGGDDILHGHTGRDRADGGPGRDRCVAERRVSC